MARKLILAWLTALLLLEESPERKENNIRVRQMTMTLPVAEAKPKEIQEGSVQGKWKSVAERWRGGA